MISEIFVLLCIEYFKQRACGVSVRVLCKLVYLIKQNKRIFDTCTTDSFDYSAGHGTDICLSVSSDIGFIAHTAERYSYKLTFERCRNT